MQPQVLIIDDHPLVARGLALLVQQDLGVVVEIASSSTAALMLLAQPGGDTRFAMALLDLEMPSIGGLEALPRLRAAAPGMAIVVVSANRAPLAAQVALQRGALAFVGKGEPPDRLMAVLRRVMASGIGLSNAAARAGFESSGATPQPCDRGEAEDFANGLTPRQREVLLLLAQGRSNKLIARHFDVSENTVRNHVGAILERLNVDNRHEAVNVATRLGWLDSAS